MPLEPKLVRAPDLKDPALKGRVVLADFWDYTCVNCIRTLPYLREWDRRYRDKGLTILGVHAPEFEFARSREEVERAAREFGLEYRIVLDNGYELWRAFANRYWPAKYLIDKDGYIRWSHFGEGKYVEAELAIQELLRDLNPAVELPPPMGPLRAADRPDAVCPRPTPELYLGSQRRRAEAFTLAGPWTHHPESIEVAPGAEPAVITLPYAAAEVNLVMARGGEIDVLDNGLALDHQSRGADVAEAADGRTYVNVDRPRMYSLVHRDRFLERELELHSRAAGLRLYAFTFTSCVPRP